MTEKQLLNSILQRAIEGKLVVQDPSDEPASKLIERIREEKTRLIKEKKIRAPKQDSYIYRKDDGSFYERIGKTEICIDDELPFEIPDSWEWARLGSIASKIGAGSTPKGGREVYQQSGIKFIRSQNVYNDGLRLSNVAYIQESIHQGKPNSQVVANDLLLNITGASIARCALVPRDFDTANINQHVLIIRLIDLEVKNFVHLMITSATTFDLIMKQQVGGTKEGLSAAKATELLIPLPPLAEQKRIIEQIEALRPLTKRYGEANAQLESLNAAFPRQLKQSLLQAAIQGQLVPQDPTDEPAQKLLDRIREEKQRLIKEKKIKAPKQESTIYRKADGSFYERIGKTETCIDDELPFTIPDSWEWARLGSIVINRDSERIPLSKEQRMGVLKIYDYYGASGIIDKVENFIFEDPLLLIGEDGANLITRSKPIAFIARGKYWVNNHAHVLEPLAGIIIDYLELFINAIPLNSYVTGTAQPKMNQKKMNTIFVCVPPIEEQIKITNKINYINKITG